MTSAVRPRTRTASRATSPTRRRGQTGARTRRAAPVTEGGRRTALAIGLTVAALTLFGLVMVLSASSVTSLYGESGSPYGLFRKQLMWAAIGGVVFVIAARIDHRRLEPLAVPILVVTVLLLLAVLVPGIGRRVNGSSRWLAVGPIVIQPGELAKFAVVVFSADLLSRRARQMHRPDLTIRPVMFVCAVLSALLLAQPKLGTAIVIAAVALTMLFLAGARLPHLFAWTAGGLVLASVAAYASPYRRARILSFLDPWADPLGSGLQTIQSQIGVASGGIFGVGLGAGRAKYGFLPYAHSDFIFAIVAEEIGLLGAVGLISGFVALTLLGARAAMRAPDQFGKLLAIGITAWLVGQGFLNIGMSLGVLPITGEPLPFVSAGGSSLVTTLGAAGILTSVARRGRA